MTSNMKTVPIPIGVSREELKRYFEVRDDGDLSSEAFTSLTAFDTRFKLLAMFLVFDAVCTSTIVVTRKSRHGTSFDTPVVRFDCSKWTNLQDIVFVGEDEIDVFQKGDEIQTDIPVAGVNPKVNMILVVLEIP